MKTWIDETWPNGITHYGYINPEKTRIVVREVLSKFRDEVEKRAMLNGGSSVSIQRRRDSAMNEIFKEIGLS